MYSSQEWWSNTQSAPDPGVTIGQSLRFRGAQNLTRTFSANISDKKTISFWMKKDVDSTSVTHLFTCGDLWSVELDSATGAMDNVPNGIGIYDGTGHDMGTGSFRDPSAWYHVVTTTESTSARIYVNGELIYSGGRNQSTPNNITIGSYYDNSFYFKGYLSNLYFIDGQVLAPTAFGNYNDDGVWVPRDVDFTASSPNTFRYSNFLTATAGDLGAGGDLPGAFCNNLAGPRYAFTAPGGQLTFAPEPPIPFTRLRACNANTAGFVNFDWNGNSVTSQGPGVLATVFDGAGELSAATPLVVNPNSGAWRAELSAIEITDANGTRLLLDPFIWSGDLYTQSNNLETPDYNSTEKNFNNPPQNAFDGDSLTSASSAATTGTWLHWRPSAPFRVNSSLRISSTYQTETINVNQVATTNNSNANGSAEWVNLSPDLTFPFDLSVLSIRGSVASGTSAWLDRVEIDGVVVEDGVNGSYGVNGFHLDFSDPNDIGADRSGNGNDFTPTGFDTVAFAGGYYADPNLAAVGGEFPNSQGAVYVDNVQPATGTLAGPGTIQALFDGDLRGNTETSGENWIYIEYSNGTRVESMDIDLRDFPTINEVAISAYNASGNTSDHAYAGVLLDSSRNEIAGTYHEVITTGNFTWHDIPVAGEPRYLRIRKGDTATTWNIQINGMRVNGQVLSQVAKTAATYDLMQDSPTQNWATLNPLQRFPTSTRVEDAYLTVTDTNASYPNVVPSTILLEGKVYWETTLISAPGYPYMGITPADNIVNGGSWYNTNSFWYRSSAATNNVNNFGTFETADFGGAVGNDIISFAFDSDVNEVTIRKNNAEAQTFSLNTDETRLTPMILSASSKTGTINFGQQPFHYTPPEGYEALQSQNLPKPTIKNGRDHFQALTGPGRPGGAGGRQGSWVQDLFTASPGSREAAMISTAKDFQGGANNAKNAFTDNIGTVCETGPVPTSGSPCWITFRPSDTTLPELTANTKLEISLRRCQELWVNGVQMTGTFTGEVTTYDLSSQLTFPFTLESVALQAIAGNDVGLGGFRLDDELLIDGGILMTAQETFPNGLWWIKDRVNNSTQHQLVDSVRGVNLALTCPTVQEPVTYTAPEGQSVAWCWNFNNANPASNGFEIIQYTGNGTSQTISHRLGKKPEFIITQPIQNTASAPSISCWHIGFGNDQHFNRLNDANAVSTGNAEMWNNIGSTSYDVGNDPKVNLSSSEMIAYAWTSIPGYSAFGTYNGNSNNDGPIIYTDFSVAWIMVKPINGAGSWLIFDSTRDPHNPVNHYLYTDLTDAEAPGFDVDFLANGFKMRHVTTSTNTSGVNYLYCAFAENPFQSPAPAR